MNGETLTHAARGNLAPATKPKSGSRQAGTNPRAAGTNPRASGTNLRAQRKQARDEANRRELARLSQLHVDADTPEARAAAAAALATMRRTLRIGDT